jgi:opacity protein-like surface antigen
MPKSALRVLMFVWCFNAVTAQNQTASNDSKPTVIGLYVDYGYLLKHTPSLKQIDDAYPRGITLEWGKLLLTEKAWEFCNCFPKVGAELSYWNFDNAEVLGNGVLAMGFLEPYFRTHKKTNLFFRAGLGAAYLSNPYDAETNPLNESYSTDLSFALMVGLGVNFRLTDSWNLRFAARYNHTSNGGISTPNKGLNFPSLSMGVSKSLSSVSFPEFDKIGKRAAPEDKRRLSLALITGWSNATVGDKDKFLVLGLSAVYSQWFGGRSAFNLGTEWIFDYSRRELINLAGEDRSFAQGAFLAGHEFWWGRVTFSQQLGVYYFNQYRISDAVYQRYGLTYHFNKRIFAGFNLKAHRHVADFFDLRVGYTF